MAQATIYGAIDQAYSSIRVTDPNALLSANGNTKTTNFSAIANGDTLIGVKGNEDLGNGLKAHYLYEFGLATDSTQAPTNRQAFIGLSGGFGSFEVGRMYNFAFNNAIANDPAGFSGTGGFVAAGAGNVGRQNKTFAYTLPSFVPGVKVQLGKSLGNNAVTDTVTVKEADSTSWGVTYANGALYAGVTGESMQTSTAGQKVKNSTATVTYDLGMVKVGYSTTKSNDPAAYLAEVASTAGTYLYETTGFVPTSYKGSATSFTVPINTSLSAFYTTGSLEMNGDTVIGDVKTNGSQLGAIYSLSKRTSVYLHTSKTKTEAADASSSAFALGMLHNF
jgi:predicted porin